MDKSPAQQKKDIILKLFWVKLSIRARLWSYLDEIAKGNPDFEKVLEADKNDSFYPSYLDELLRKYPKLNCDNKFWIFFGLAFHGHLFSVLLRNLWLLAEEDEEILYEIECLLEPEEAIAAFEETLKLYLDIKESFFSEVNLVLTLSEADRFPLDGGFFSDHGPAVRFFHRHLFWFFPFSWTVNLLIDSFTKKASQETRIKISKIKLKKATNVLEDYETKFELLKVLYGSENWDHSRKTFLLNILCLLSLHFNLAATIYTNFTKRVEHAYTELRERIIEYTTSEFEKITYGPKMYHHITSRSKHCFDRSRKTAESLSCWKGILESSEDFKAISAMVIATKIGSYDPHIDKEWLLSALSFEKLSTKIASSIYKELQQTCVKNGLETRVAFTLSSIFMSKEEQDQIQKRASETESKTLKQELSITETVKTVGISKPTIYNWRKKGKIPKKKKYGAEDIRKMRRLREEGTRRRQGYYTARTITKAILLTKGIEKTTGKQINRMEKRIKRSSKWKPDSAGVGGTKYYSKDKAKDIFMHFIKQKSRIV